MPIIRNYDDYFTEVEKTAPIFGNGEKKSYEIENLFKPTYIDGKTDVVMRFLPSHPSESKPFIEHRRSHVFKINNGNSWFGSDCLEKFGKPCPICDYNRNLYRTMSKDEAYKLRLPRARRKFITNVYIIRNDNAPETEGNVYRFEYGVYIMDLIRKVMTGYDDPDEGHIPGFNVFNCKKGANFVYTGVMGQYGPDIKSSCFKMPRPLAYKDGTILTDAELVAIEAQLYTLKNYDRKEENCKSYQEICQKYFEKTGKELIAGTAHVPAPAVTSTPAPASAPVVTSTPAPASAPVVTSTPAVSDDEDDFIRMLNNM